MKSGYKLIKHRHIKRGNEEKYSKKIRELKLLNLLKLDPGVCNMKHLEMTSMQEPQLSLSGRVCCLSCD